MRLDAWWEAVLMDEDEDEEEESEEKEVWGWMEWSVAGRWEWEQEIWRHDMTVIRCR